MDIIKQLEIYANNMPDKIAFHSRMGEISYGELWDKSGKLSAIIEQKLGSDKKPVVVYGHKNPLMLTAFIACVRSGRAYCPVDTNMPEDRIIDIIESVGNSLVISTETLDNIGIADALDIRNGSIFESEEIIAPAKRVAGDDIYYIIFTSGSTGKPKGVQISLNNLNNYLAWSTTLGGEHGVFLNQAPFSFDLSVMDLYTGLATGSGIWAVDKALQQQPKEMLSYISEGGITHWVSTPSFVDMCLGDPSFNGDNCSEINTFLFCGETLTKSTAKRLLDRFPGARVINTYGPTESTVCVTSVEVTREMIEAEESIPIGKCKPGTEILISNDNKPMRTGESGELIILGDTVSPGYFNNKEKTDAVFGSFTQNGVEIPYYRTGDSGHYGEDGMLYYEGRIDNQIKLHGYRIELGDIESNLMNIKGIKSAAVIPLKKDGVINMLCAFVVRSEDSEITDDYAGRKAVREGLRELLPAYMVPKKVVFTEAMPMTMNGKIDRRQLEKLV